MPITSLQSEILRIIAAHRDPESFIAGGVPINRLGPRYSSDIDIFQDRIERVGIAAEADGKALEAAGFTVSWQRRLPAIISADIGLDGAATKLEWACDSDYRFFPAVPDDQFGYMLSIADLSINKLMAAVGRREPRDIVDLLTLHERHLPLGAIAWAAAEIAPGFTPEGLLSELKRAARYRDADFAQLASVAPISAADIARRLAAAVDHALLFVAAMPTEKAGLLFLESGVPVQPDPSRIDSYEQHSASRRGHWPSTTELSSAMLQRYTAS